MVIRQLRSNDGTGTLSYVIVDEEQHVGCIIDPNIEDVRAIDAMLTSMECRLTAIIDTHTHADHVSAAGALRIRTGAQTIMHSNTKNKWKIIDEGDKFGIGDTLRENAKIPIDRYVEDGDEVHVGSLTVGILFTPGHTDNHISPLIGENVFTGDLLLMGQAGRSDLPGGDAEQQYESLFRKILALPDRTRVYPGHDYEGKEFSYLGDERRLNPFLQPRTKQQFIEFVRDFFPPFSESVASGNKMTLQCGVQRIMQPGETIRNISARDLHSMMADTPNLCVLDVREPYELIMSGAIEGVLNVPIGSLKENLNALPKDKKVTIVCVCQSGNRSVEAAHYLKQNGYENVINLEGGTSAWRTMGYSVADSTRQISQVSYKSQSS